MLKKMNTNLATSFWRKKLGYAVVFTLAFTFFNEGYSQWLKPKGHGYYKLGAWILVADEHYTDQGLIDPNATRGLFVNSLFAKYGLSDKVNVIAHIPFLVKNYQFAQISKTNGRTIEEGQSLTGFGDINAGFEFRLKRVKKWNFSTSLIFGIPTGNASGGFDGSYQTGDGEFNQQLNLKAGSGYKLAKLNFYVKSSVGFNNRTKGFSDELRLSAETGTQILKKRLLLLGRMGWIRPLKNGTLDATNANGAVFANNIETLTWGMEGAYKLFKKGGVSFAFTTPIYGRLIYRSTSFSGGIYVDM